MGRPRRVSGAPGPRSARRGAASARSRREGSASARAGLRRLQGRKHPGAQPERPAGVCPRALTTLPAVRQPRLAVRLRRLGRPGRGSRSSQRRRPAEVAAAGVRSRPGQGRGQGSGVARAFWAPHWHRARRGRRPRLGLPPREGGGGACPRVTPPRRKGGPLAAASGTTRGREGRRVRQLGSGAPRVGRAPPGGRGWEIPSRVRIGAREKSGVPREPV